jgi:AcrR family transcriptional regulator
LKSASRNLRRVTGSIKKQRGVRQAVVGRSEPGPSADQRARNSPPSRLGQSYRVGRIKREAILRAAEATLITHGHARFTVERVAARLNISPGNLNYYFPTKASLLEALIS